MATKPPPAVEEFASESLERTAYAVVSGIETQEPNDRARLGYHVWAWLRERKGTLEEAVIAAGSRTKLGQTEVINLIKKRLAEKGVK
jgi:hypothetical protein